MRKLYLVTKDHCPPAQLPAVPTENDPLKGMQSAPATTSSSSAAPLPLPSSKKGKAAAGGKKSSGRSGGGAATGGGGCGLGRCKDNPNCLNHLGLLKWAEAKTGE